jgi:hypothetical protein
MHGMAQPIQRCRGSTELAFVLHFESNGLIDGVAFEIAQGMGPVVRSEIKSLA